MANEKKTTGIRTATLVPPAPQASPRELLEKKAPPSSSSVGNQALATAAAASQASVVATPATCASVKENGGSSVEPHAVEGRVLPGRPISDVEKEVARSATDTVATGATGKIPARSIAGTSGKVAPVASPKPAPMASIASRLADMLELDAGAPPASLRGGSTNALHTGHFHFMLYGEPNTFKTTVAAEFMGPGHTLIIMTRRESQLTPLARKGYKFLVAEDADSLRWALLHTDKAAELAAQAAGDPEWAPLWKIDPDRTLIIDDVTEGTNVLKEDYMYVLNKELETVRIKDPRQAYKKAADELHDYLKIVLGRPQHVGLVALDKSFDVEGTSDNRTEPDMPNKMMKLVETELEYVFFFPHGDRMQTKTSKVVRSAQLEGKKETVTWNEITFAKCKLPIEYLGKGVVADMAPKNLRVVWAAIQAAMKGEWKPPAPQSVSSSGKTPLPPSKPTGVNLPAAILKPAAPSSTAPPASKAPSTAVSNAVAAAKK
jgi:hypothetical protein